MYKKKSTNQIYKDWFVRKERIRELKFIEAKMCVCVCVL